MTLLHPKIHHAGRRPKPRAPLSPTTLENRLILDLHAAIKQYGYTTSSIAETAGVAKGALRGWQTGGRWGSPKLRSFCAVLEALGLTMIIVPMDQEERDDE